MFPAKPYEMAAGAGIDRKARGYFLRGPVPPRAAGDLQVRRGSVVHSSQQPLGIDSVCEVGAGVGQGEFLCPQLGSSPEI